MFSHVLVGTNDLTRSKAFYDALLATLGAKPGFVDGERRVFWRTGGCSFATTLPINGEAPTCANGGTIGFKCDSQEQVDAWHAAGVANGGVSIEDPPGWRGMDIGKMYLAYLRDPDGNKLCAVFR